MKSIFKYTCVLAMGLAVSCSKDDGNAGGDYEDNFVFYVNANIDGNPIQLYAGDEQYILDTDYDFNAPDSLVEMRGLLNTQDSGSHTNAFMIKLLAKEAVSSEPSFNIFENLAEGNIALTDASGYKNDPDNFNLNLSPDVISSNYTYLWNFQDGTTSSTVSPTVAVSAVETPVFEVSLGADPYNGSCSSKTTHFINIDEECDATIIVTPNHVFGGLKGSLITRRGKVQSVDWSIGSTDLGHNLVVNNLPLNDDGNYRLRAEVSFENGCQKIIEKDINVLGGVPNFCDIDFSYIKDPVKIFDPKQRGTLELVYYDATGKRFSSNYDGAEGRFKIHNIRSFNTNDKSQSTISFQFEGRAVLKSSDGSTVNVENAFGNFAVAHP